MFRKTLLIALMVLVGCGCGGSSGSRSNVGSSSSAATGVVAGTGAAAVTKGNTSPKLQQFGLISASLNCSVGNPCQVDTSTFVSAFRTSSPVSVVFKLSGDDSTCHGPNAPLPYQANVTWTRSGQMVALEPVRSCSSYWVQSFCQQCGQTGNYEVNISIPATGESKTIQFAVK